jgi:hypothetical protein
MPPHRHFGFGAENRFLEAEIDIFSKIGSALNPTAPPRTAAEKISETEEITEDVAEILEDGRVEPCTTSATDTSVAEAVIHGPLLAISQNCISFAGFLELLFRVGVVGVAVGMKLQSQLAIRTLDFLLAGRTSYTENFVIVAFSVTGQNGLSVPFEAGYFLLLRATFTIEGRRRRSLSLYPFCNSSKM